MSQRTLSSTGTVRRTVAKTVIISVLGFCSCTSTYERPRPGSNGVPAPTMIGQHNVPFQQPGVGHAGLQGPELAQVGYLPRQNDPFDRPEQFSTRRPALPDLPVEFTAAMARVDDEVELASYHHQQIEDETITHASDLYPDEYLFDGGDRALPFHYENNAFAGFESEDTIAQFETHTGDLKSKKSTRVAIYSPRFASISTISEPMLGQHAQTIAGADKTIATYDMKARQTTVHHNDFFTPGGVRMRARASGLEGEFETHGLNQNTVAGRNDKLEGVFENQKYLTTTRLDQMDQAVLADHVNNAVFWTRTLSPSITASSTAGNQVYGSFKPMEIVGTEDKRKTKGDLQIVKLADKKIAAPGDEIIFTLRYENTGDFELKNIRIVDNLTPRLEFIAGSENYDGLEGSLQTYDNGEGSLILSFSIDGELKGHSAGTVSFKARVRGAATAE